MRIQQAHSSAASHSGVRKWLLGLALTVGAGNPAIAQVVPYVGGIAGFATLSADAGSEPTSQGLRLSAYSPKNGAALDIFAGVHLHDYFSVQANYIWNENDLVLKSAASSSNTFYEQARTSSQHAAIFDVLVYFRRRSSRLRPYLGLGAGVVHFSSHQVRVIRSGGSPRIPPDQFAFNSAVLRSHVGIDLRIARKLDFRYSFSETFSENGISRQLSPPGPRKLSNFQNLFGFLVRF